MVTTTELKPMPALQPYVRCYALREFDTMGADMVKPIHAMHEFYMTFFLKGTTLLHFKENKTTAFSQNDSWALGLQTEYKGNLIFNGKYSIFTIQFKPNGFYKIFGVPMVFFTDQIHISEDVFGKDIHLLHEQLHGSESIMRMAYYAENFLITFLLKSKVSDPYNRINSASGLILQHAGNINIEQLACHTNMSLRRFEINFNEQVGVPPKLFARMTRFNHAIKLKQMQPEKHWISIAYECNYHDQMHLIKDFKEFGGEAPLTFFKHTPPPEENYNKLDNP